MNDSSRGWNAPLTTTPVWIVNASTPLLAVSVHATGKAVEAPAAYGGSLSLTLTTGALLNAWRQLAAVTVTSYVPAPACVIEAPEPLVDASVYVRPPPTRSPLGGRAPS